MFHVYLIYHPVFLTLLYFTTFHAWSTVLNEQAGGLHRVLLGSSSGIEEGEVTRDEDGTTNLGYENSTFSAASDEDEDESDGTSAKVTAVHEQDDDHCGLGNSTD